MLRPHEVCKARVPRRFMNCRMYWPLMGSTRILSRGGSALGGSSAGSGGGSSRGLLLPPAAGRPAPGSVEGSAVPGVEVEEGPELGVEVPEPVAVDEVPEPVAVEEAPEPLAVEGVPEVGAEVGGVEEAPEALAACRRSTRAACFMNFVSATHGRLLRKAFQAHVDAGCSRSFCSSFAASSDFAEPLFLSGWTSTRSFRNPCFRAACMEPPCSTARQAKRVNRQRRLSTRSMAMSRNSARAFSRAGSEKVVMTAELVVMLAQKLQAATCQGQHTGFPRGTGMHWAPGALKAKSCRRRRNLGERGGAYCSMHNAARALAAHILAFNGRVAIDDSCDLYL